MAKKTGEKKINLFGAISINIVLLALGLCLVVWADKVTSIISIVLGVILFIIATYYVIDYIKDSKREDKDGEISKIISAIFLGLIGAFLIYNNGFIKEFISIIVGAGLVLFGLSGISSAVEFKKIDHSAYTKGLVFGAISTIAGALCILGCLIVPDLMLQILGVMMIIFSFSQTGTVTLERDQVKKSKKPNADQAIEAEVVEKKT